MSDLSKRLLELHAQTTQGIWESFCEDDEYFMGAFGVRCASDEVGPHHRDAEMNGEIDPNDSICITTVQTPMTVGHRSPRWDHNANFIAEAHESVPALCAEIESLETELAYERDARRLRVKQTSFAYGCRPEGWGVYNENDRRLSRSGDWDYQPLPSNRTDEWIAEHSWPTMRAAVDAARNAEAKT